MPTLNWSEDGLPIHTVVVSKKDNHFPASCLTVGMAFWNPRNMRGKQGNPKRKCKPALQAKRGGKK